MSVYVFTGVILVRKMKSQLAADFIAAHNSSILLNCAKL